MIKKKGYSSSPSPSRPPPQARTIRSGHGFVVLFLAFVLWSASKNSAILDLSSSATSSLLLEATSTMMTTTGASSLKFPSTFSNNNTNTNNDDQVVYKPAALEDYLLTHKVALGFNTSEGKVARACSIWQNNRSHPILHRQLHAFRTDLLRYKELLEQFTPLDYDLRHRLARGEPSEQVCRAVELHAQGLAGLFPSAQLSRSNRSGYVEPLFPPMRHPDYCLSKKPKQFLFDPSYMIHDFGALCRQLRPTSRIVLVDMGASLIFHEKYKLPSPVLHLVALFRKFGMRLDHLYAYEANVTAPETVYDRIPPDLVAAYHWYNVPVSSTVGHKANPLTTLLQEFTTDDLILVKLDVDTPSVELPLFQQILHDPQLTRLIDHFYFEHHVHMAELAFKDWKVVQGSIAETLEWFQSLRYKGVMAHYWM